MPGIKGSKQHKSLTLEQIEELKGQTIFTEDGLVSFLTKHKLTFKAFKRRATAAGLKVPFGYSYKEYLTRQELQSPYNKNNIVIDCPCGKQYITVLFGFHKRKHKAPVCGDCYRKTYAYDDDWKLANSKAQKVSQNKPETLVKQVASQIKRHQQQGMKELYQSIGRYLWEDPVYRKKVIANSSISKHGIHKGLVYQSSLELAFICQMLEEGKTIKNYDGSGIPYVMNGKEHKYYPDFIVDEKELVEVKGHGSIYKKHYDRNQAKFAVLKSWCISNGFTARIVFDTDIGKRAIKEARLLHGTLDKENVSALRGQGS